MKEAVCYARYSSFNQNEISIEAQLRAIRNYALQKGIEITKVYTDEAKTATNDSRPNFLHMIADLDVVRPDLVLVHKLDRFARNRTDAAIYRKEIQSIGARLVAVDQDFGDGPEAVLMEAVLEGNAEFFSKNLSREVKKGQYEAVTEKHTHCGGIPPLGYDVGPDRKYVINEHEAQAVRIIYQMKLEGKSYPDIVHALNSDEAGYRSKKGQTFRENSIHDILRNEKYIGTYVYRKTSPNNSRIARDPLGVIRVPNAIPPIISEDIWYKVQELMDSKKCHPRARSESVYILTGLAKCSECGHAMVGSRQFQKGKQHEYYRCNLAKRSAGIECSNTHKYRREALEQKVVEKVKEFLQDISGDKLDSFSQMVYEECLQRLSLIDSEQQVAKKELQQVQHEMDNLISSIAAGVDPAILAPKLNDLGRKKDSLARSIKKPQNVITIEEVQTWVTKLLDLSLDPQDPVQCRQDLHEILDYVIISDQAPDLGFKQLGIVR